MANILATSVSILLIIYHYQYLEAIDNTIIQQNPIKPVLNMNDIIFIKRLPDNIYLKNYNKNDDIPETSNVNNIV